MIIFQHTSNIGYRCYDSMPRYVFFLIFQVPCQIQCITIIQEASPEKKRDTSNPNLFQNDTVGNHMIYHIQFIFILPQQLSSAFFFPNRYGYLGPATLNITVCSQIQELMWEHLDLSAADKFIKLHRRNWWDKVEIGLEMKNAYHKIVITKCLISITLHF